MSFVCVTWTCEMWFHSLIFRLLVSVRAFDLWIRTTIDRCVQWQPLQWSQQDLIDKYINRSVNDAKWICRVFIPCIWLQFRIDRQLWIVNRSIRLNHIYNICQNWKKISINKFIDAIVNGHFSQNHRICFSETDTVERWHVVWTSSAVEIDLYSKRDNYYQ